MSSGSRPRLHVPGLRGGDLELELHHASYLRRVLRLRPGDTVTLFDGSGLEARARIVSCGRRSVVVEVAEPVHQDEPAPEFTVGLATPKAARADWAVEKLSELGATRIAFLSCGRSVARPHEAGERKVRWQRLAAKATSQCGRARVPQIEGPLALTAFLRLQAHTRLVGDRSGLPVHEILAQTEANASVALLVGPEGGLTAEELVQTRNAGYTAVVLSPHTLRVETAAVAGTAIVMSRTSWGHGQS